MLISMKLKRLIIISLVLAPVVLLANQNLSISQVTDSCLRYMYTDTTRANRYFDLLIESIPNEPGKWNKANAARVVANYYTKNQDYVNALNYYELALGITANLKDCEMQQLSAQIITNYALIYHSNGDLTKAMEMYLEAERRLMLCPENHLLLSQLYSKMGDIYFKTLEYDKAVDYTQKSVDHARYTNDKKQQANANMHYGNILVYQDKTIEAEPYFELAEKLALEAEAYELLTNIHYNMGFRASQADEFEKALMHYEKSADYAKKAGLTFDYYDALYKIGLMYHYQGKHNVAADKLTTLLPIVQKAGFKLLERNIYDALSFVENERGNFKAAYDYLGKYIDLVYELYPEENRKQIEFLKARFQAEKQEQEIIKRDLEIKQKTTVITFVIIALALLLIISALIFISNHRKKQAAMMRIKALENEKQLVAATSALKGEETERTRLARDLHDGLGGLLTSMKLSLSTMGEKVFLDDNGRKMFANALDLLDMSVKELHQVANNMMPESLLNYGIKTAVENFVKNLKSKENCNLAFRFYGLESRFRPDFEMTVYRMVQELYNNALKHADATEISLQMVVDQNRLNLSYEDNGKGFNIKAIDPKKGLGLGNLMARVKAFGGDMDITSHPDKGTEVIIEFNNVHKYINHDSGSDC